MTNLRFTAVYIRALAKLQENAAREIGYATRAVDNVGEKVASTHGWICKVTASALTEAEDQRFLAAIRTQAASSDLAEKLKHAADKYEEIDATEGEKIDGQMRPGG